MRSVWIVLAALVVFAAPTAFSQSPDDPAPGVDIAGFRGDCRLTTAGKTIDCKSVVYMHFKANGRTNFGAIVDEQTMTSFSGGKDEQPKPTEYWLEVDRVLQGAAGEVTEHPGKGRCDIRLSEDGNVVHSMVCRATIDGGLVELKFSGRRTN